MSDTLKDIILAEMMDFTVNHATGRLHHEPNQQQNAYNIPAEPQPMRFSKDQDYGFQYSFCTKMETWQRNIVNQLRSGNDVYVVAAPGGGKTLPIFCHWTNDILGLNTMLDGNPVSPVYMERFQQLLTQREKVSKIAFLVPTRSLAMQTEHDVKQIFAQVLAQGITRIMSTAESAIVPPPFIQQNHILLRLFMEIRTIWSYLQNPVDEIQKARYDDMLKNHYNQFKEEVANTLQDYINTKLIKVKTGGYEVGDKDCPVVISIYESGYGLIPSLNNLELLIIDEAHLTQMTGEFIDDQREKQISAALYSILKDIKGQKKTKVVMLSGTVHPKSAEEITRYLNNCFDRRFQKVNGIITSESGNRSQVDIVPDDSINNTQEMANIIVKAISNNDWGLLIVLYSARKINDIAEIALKRLGVQNLRDIGNNTQYGGTSFGSSFSGLNRHDPKKLSVKQPWKTLAHHAGQPSAAMGEAASIKDPLLRACVSAGFGFIYRNRPDGQGEIEDSDKFIVAKLFKDKKLKALLATDAVGIGVNIDVKRLYIPKVDKFSAGEMRQVTLRDLAQILNRSGRGSVPYASIHTPIDNVEAVTNALAAKPGDFNIVPAFMQNTIGGAACYSQDIFHLYYRIFNGS